MDKEYKLIGLGATALILVGILVAPYWQGSDMDHERDEFISQKNRIIGEMISKGEYRCCLEEPCTYCIEKSPGHGEGAECSCLEDVVNGVHPCGECIGEIMEGHGNQYLSKYFAKAIAEEVGEEHYNTLKRIMSQKYNISVEEQI